MKLYLLNALITPFKAGSEETAVFVCRKIDQSTFEDVIRAAEKDGWEIVSALGHQTTVDFLHSILAPDVAKYVTFNRQEVYFEPGDVGLIWRVFTRTQEFKEWSVEELKEFYQAGKTEFLMSARVFAPELILNPAKFCLKEDK